MMLSPRHALSMTIAHAPTRAGRGHTVIEIIAICAIVAVMAGITIPAATNFYTGQKLAVAAAALVADVRAARYGALQTQGLYRLAFFDSHPKWGRGYVVSYFRPTTDPTDANSVPVGASLNKALVTDGDPTNDETGCDDWVPSEGIESVHVLPDGLKWQFAPNPPPVLFFRADGTIHRHPTDPQPLGSITVTLATDDDSSNYSVNISTIGAIESDSYDE